MQAAINRNPPQGEGLWFMENKLVKKNLYHPSYTKYNL